MATEAHLVRKQRNRFAVWAWSPIIVLRVALFLKYAGYAYASVIAFLAGVPIFDLTTPVGYTVIWAILLGVSAILSAVGASNDKWQSLEKWSSLVLSATILTYALPMNLVGFGMHDLGRQFVGAIALIGGILPFCRFVYLAAQTGKRKLNDLSGAE